jgi:NAD dependent epimerase/dehydratase family enzyme
MPNNKANGGSGSLDTCIWHFSIEGINPWQTSSERHKNLPSECHDSQLWLTWVFDVFLGLIRHGLGGRTLPGNQFVTSIHETDFIRSVEFLVERQDLSGAVNLASPNPLPNRDFLHILRQAWGIRVGLPTTRWMIEVGTFLLRTESELVLKSRQVVPGRLVDAGFEFTYPMWPEAASELVARWRRTRC